MQQLHWLSVPERVTFKLCVMVHRCLHGIGPEYFSEDFKLVSEIQSRQRLRSASCTDVVVPATRRSSLGDRAFQSQELERGTHCRPVSPPHHLCPHSGDSWRRFFSSDNGVNNTNYCVVVLKCLALSTTLIVANWTELNTAERREVLTAKFFKRQVLSSSCQIDETMTLPAVCETLNRFIHFEHEQIDSANHFYRTVSITIHNPQ